MSHPIKIFNKLPSEKPGYLHLSMEKSHYPCHIRSVTQKIKQLIFKDETKKSNSFIHKKKQLDRIQFKGFILGILKSKLDCMALLSSLGLGDHVLSKRDIIKQISKQCGHHPCESSI